MAATAAWPRWRSSAFSSRAASPRRSPTAATPQGRSSACKGHKARHRDHEQPPSHRGDHRHVLPL
eukprot:7044604-Heterocapsa_arctica.AAC.1